MALSLRRIRGPCKVEGAKHSSNPINNAHRSRVLNMCKDHGYGMNAARRRIESQVL
jgi:hypothetical protein